MKQGFELSVHVQNTRAYTQVYTTQTGLDNGYYILLILGQLNCFCNTLSGGRGSTVVKMLVRSQMVSFEFFIDIKSFRSHYGPGVDSASNGNEYQEHFLGVKTAGA